MKNKIKANHPLMAFCLSLTLGLSLLTPSWHHPGVARAFRPDDASDQDEQPPAIGIASNALECLAVGDDSPGNASGIVNLSWPGQAERARLIMRVSGAEATHTIKINGQAVAAVPIHPGGQACRNGESFYLDIPPEVLVQGDNRIEMTNDALPNDNWTAAQVRLEVLGHFSVLPAENLDHNAPNAPSAVTEYTIITFINPYDGSSQEAKITRGSYNDPLPLVIYAHGRSVDMNRGEEVLGEAIEDKGWLLASPQLHGSWTGEPQPDPPGKYAYASLESQYDIIGVMNYMLDNYNVDTDRIYLVGYSMGGQLDTITAAKFPHVFAAVFDNKGPTDMDQWYYENTGTHQRWMRRECHIGEVEQNPSQNPFCYQRRSSVNFASDYLHIPISITHSVDDELVPIDHSQGLRDAINSYAPDQPASIFEDTVVGPTCPPSYHCYEPDPMAVLNFLESFTLDNTPSHINITTDESKSYYWLNIAQTGGDHWSQIKVDHYPISATVMAIISDTEALAIALNLGSTDLASTSVSDKLKQPGMGLPATTYLVKGGGNNYLHDYTSGYLTTSLSTTGQFTLTISAIKAKLSANPAMVSGGQSTTSTITASFQDRLGNPVPDGVVVQFSTTAGTFPNESSTYTTTLTGGQVATTLTLEPAADLAEITARVESVSGSVSVDVIHPGIELLATPDKPTIYSGNAVTYTYRLTNSGDITLTHVTLVDDNGTPGDSGDDLTICANVTLTAGLTTSYSHSATLTQTTTSAASVAGQDPLGHDVSDSDPTTVNVISPAIDLLLTPHQTTAYHGELVPFTHQITNTGDTTLTGVTVSDDYGPVCEDTTLMAGEVQSCVRSLVLSQTTTITSTVTAQDPLGHDVAANDSTTVSVISPAIDLIVTPHQAAVYHGEFVTFTYQITNSGDATLTGVTVSDDDGTVCENIALTAKETQSCMQSLVLSQTSTITATVIGQDPLGHDVSDSDSTSILVIFSAIDMLITPHQTTIYRGDSVTCTYRITNIGGATLTGVTASDDNGAVCENITLMAGETQSCMQSLVLSQTTTITATAIGQDSRGHDVVADDSTTVSVISPMIDLLATPHQATVDAGKFVTFTYQITNSGDTTLTDVTVTNDGGTVCENITLAVGAIHSCAQNTQLFQTTTITSTVTGQDPLGHTVKDSDSTTVIVQWPDDKVYLPVVTRNN